MLNEIYKVFHLIIQFTVGVFQISMNVVYLNVLMSEEKHPHEGIAKSICKEFRKSIHFSLKIVILDQMALLILYFAGLYQNQIFMVL